jgi:hypothetical protein
LSHFTVISFYTPDFAHFAADLRADCERFGYQFEIAEIPEAHSLVGTWDRKVEHISGAIERLGTVLWLDVECRLRAPIPEDWIPPLTSTFPMGKSRPVSTGVLLLNRSHLPLVEVWTRHARKETELPDDYVLEFLLSQYDLPFNFVETEFFDRQKSAQIVRGQWAPEGVVIQHSTINRWPDPVRYSRAFNGKNERISDISLETRIARKRKTLFWRNFGGDFEEIERIMATDADAEHELNEWVFHPARQEYAPAYYWNSHPEFFGVKPLTREAFWEHTGRGFQINPFREKAIRRMRLAREDKSVYPLKREIGFLRWLKRPRLKS